MTPVPEITEVPVPLAVRQLVDVHNQRIQDSLRGLQTANLELMQIMNLRPEDGWRLDLDNLRYVRIATEPNDTPVG
jgi:hypothetical protein